MFYGGHIMRREKDEDGNYLIIDSGEFSNHILAEIVEEQNNEN